MSTLPERALAAALAILEETGDEASVTMRELARRCKVSAPSLYEYFPGVEQIRIEAVRSAYADFAHAARNALANQVTPDGPLVALCDAYVAYARAHPGLYRTVIQRTNPSRIDDVGADAATIFGAFAALVAAQKGLGPDAPQARRLAVDLWLGLHGIASLIPSHPGFEWPEDADLVRTLVARLLAL